jgi:hypothetical protein
MNIDELKSLPWNEGPPIPIVLDPYLPWHGYWPWYHAPNTSLQDGTVTFNFISPTPTTTAITILGNPVNITPGQAIAFAPGTYPWTASAAGYADGGGTFVVKPNQPTTVNVQLVATTAQNGTLVVNFTAVNATVVVAGITVTSGQSLTLPVGSYEWSASAPNYDSQQGSVTIVEGTNPPLNITLLPSGTNPTTGTVSITFTPASATVYLNGNPYSGSQYPSGTVWAFDPGTYPWSVGASGYITQSGTFTIVAGQETTIPTVNLVLSTGITLPPGTGFGVIPGSITADTAGVHFDLANWDVGIPTGGQGQITGSGQVALNIAMPTFTPYDAVGNGGPTTTTNWWVVFITPASSILLPLRATGVHVDIPWSVGTIVNATDAIADPGQQDYKWLEQNGYLSPGFTIDLELVLEVYTSQGYLTETQFAPIVTVVSSV